jgi:hypothetical protein
VLINTKQLYITDSYGAEGHWNKTEIMAPVATRWIVEGQNWPVSYRMGTTVLIDSQFCEFKNLILSLVQVLSDFTVGLLNMYMRKMFIICFVSKTIINFCK